MNNHPVGQLHSEDQEEYEASLRKEKSLLDENGYITVKVDTTRSNVSKNLENWIISKYVKTSLK